jgi:hypothetical protein
MRTRPNCPECKTADSVKKIIYGMPSRMPTEADDWVTGGCVITMVLDDEGKEVISDPRNHCTKCELDF